MLSLVLPARIDCLKNMLDFVLAEARKRGLTECAESRLGLAVEEIFVNVCRYAFDPPGSGTIEGVLLPASPDNPACLCLKFRDNGIAFNPLKDPPAPDLTSPLEHRRRGGLGIHLVRQLTTALSYQRIAGKNELLLEFNFDIGN